MAYIKTMKDTNGKTIYPQTHAQAVYTSDGMTLEAKLNGLPTKVSEFENDTGFITNTVDNLTNYYKKTELYTQTEVNNLINAITTMNVEVVTVLPTENISTTTIYLKAIEGEGDNNHEEWLYANGAWELIGTTAIDLTPYATKEYVNTKFVDNQANWNETDETSASYIQNRPFGLFIESAGLELLPVSIPTTRTFSTTTYIDMITYPSDLYNNKEMIQKIELIYDNISYIVEKENIAMGSGYDNGYYYLATFENTPFTIELADMERYGETASYHYLYCNTEDYDDTKTIGVKIYYSNNITKKIETKYLPLDTTIIENSTNPVTSKAIQKYVDTQIGAIDVTKDWNENDNSSAKYIQNRTHYELPYGDSYETFTNVTANQMVNDIGNFPMNGEEFIVLLTNENEAEQVITTTMIANNGTLTSSYASVRGYCGNLKLLENNSMFNASSYPDTGETWCYITGYIEIPYNFFISSVNVTKVDIRKAGTTIKKLDNKYLDIANIKTSELNNDANFINEETVNTKINAISTVKDWNENDTSAAAYIENRTHYVDGVEEIEVFNYAFEAETGEVPSNNPFVFEHWSPNYKQNIEEGKTYKIRWDGTIYNCVPYLIGSRAYFGNLSLALMGEDTGEPFCIVGRGAE